MAPTLLCPTCRRPVEWTDAFPDRPFCSARCRLIDLGAWLTEQHAIPGEPADPHEQQRPPADPGEDA
jgi:hypothetical protein